ncbi:hypothetical protein DL96DRAFT_1626239 [Flagelloscypha sp. PMI_526]|nr:hypothetical protein DL96DRAFT_1626239 [Flagelloscypha sp. PMI_526]
MDRSQMPLDLTLIIIDLATYGDRQTSLCLTLVSKEVQGMADRALFHDIYIDDDIHPQTSQMLQTMLSPSCSSPRFLRARKYVQSVRAPAKRWIGSIVLEQVFRRCPNLRTVVSSDNNRPVIYSWLAITPPPSFKTLGFTAPWNMDGWSNQPIFKTITHLVIEEEILLLHDSRVRVMGHLTHIFLGCSRSSVPPWTMVTLLTQLQLYLVFLGFSHRGMTNDEFYSTIAESEFSDIQQGKVDNRFVIVVPHQHSMWAGSQTCGGFLVAPEWRMDFGWGVYPTHFKDRKPLYDWIQSSWTEGERIVRARSIL